MADQNPPAGGPPKPTDKKDTVRITLPPRPMQSTTHTAAPAPATPATGLRPGATVPAMPVPGKKETSRLKKTTGKVPGATKPAMPVVPPPTIRAQPVVPAPSTVAAAPAPPTAAPTRPASVAAPDATNRPTVKLQTADIPKAPAPVESRPVSSAPLASGPVTVAGGPTVVDAVLGVLVMAVSAAVTYLLYAQTTIK
jgi:hypothetical protein